MEQDTPVRAAPGGAELDLWVIPGAARTELKGIYNGAIRVRVAAPPAGGEANRALLRFLGKRLKSSVTLVSGASSRKKRVHVDCADLKWIAESLGVGAD